jgi:hypothetical protein
MTYTIDQIKTAWSDYKTRQIFRVQNNGEWEITDTFAGAVVGTRAEMCAASKAMSFPKFIEFWWK